MIEMLEEIIEGFNDWYDSVLDWLDQVFSFNLEVDEDNF